MYQCRLSGVMFDKGKFDNFQLNRDGQYYFMVEETRNQATCYIKFYRIYLATTENCFFCCFYYLKDLVL
jgi:hypothetical protein